MNTPIPCARSSTIPASRALLACAVAATLLASGAPTLAQTTSPATAPKKTIRRSVLDLLAEVKKPRQGEIRPETEPTPAPAPPAAPEAAPSNGSATARPETGESSPTTSTGEVPAPGVKPTAKPIVKPDAEPAEHTDPRKPAGRSDTHAPATTDAADTSRAARPTPSITRTPLVQASGTRFVAFDKANLHVLEQHGNATLIQWRLADDGTGKPGAWEPVPADAQITERREFRTGVGVSLDVRIDDQATVTVGPLSRVLLDRRVRSDATSFPGVTLSRGEITIDEKNSSEVFVKTGSDTFLARSGRVTFDGFDVKSK